MNPMEIVFWAMYTWFFFSILMLVIIKFRTHAFTELWAQWKKKPITMVGRKEGGGVMRIADRITEGMAYFIDKKRQHGYIMPMDASTQFGSTKYNFAVEDRGYIIPLRILTIASELKNNGFQNYSEIEIAHNLRKLEDKHGFKIRLEKQKDGTNAYNNVKVTSPEGKEVIMKSIDFAKEEIIKDSPLMRASMAGEEIEDVIYRGLHHKNYGDSFYNVQNFFKCNMPPSVVENIISSDVAAAKKEASGGSSITADQLRGVAIFLLIAAVIYIMLFASGALTPVFNSISGALGGGPAAAGPAAAPTLPKPPIGIT